MERRLIRNIGFYGILAIVLIVIAVTYMKKGETPNRLTLTDFIKQTKVGSVESVTIKDKNNYLEGVYKKPYFEKHKPELKNRKFEVYYPSNYDITAVLLGSGIKTTTDPQAPIIWLDLLQNILPFVLFFVLWVFLIQQLQGGGNKVMSFGKSRHKRIAKDQPVVTFKDVAGLEEAVEELKEIKEFLSNPAKFQALGAKIPKGVLLFGPPGSGKTLLARAVAGEAQVPFLTISGSDFVEMFVGVGASRVRDLFEDAKASAPSIIFMDEIDAVGRHRGAGLGGGHDEREQTLNQLLVEMDGFNVKDSVILIAATNRPDILDPALLRPGRFDRQIVVDRPDLSGRREILKVHARGKPLAKDADLDVLARRTPGFTGADLANMINEGALLSARNNKKQIGMAELEESIERVIAGPERKTRLISDKEKRVIAYHEGGHALVAHMLPHSDPVHKISIIPRGRALGYTLRLPTEDRFLVSKSELTDDLAVFLGGRVAEEMVFDDVTTGAHDDLERATKVARQMVCEYGMSDKLGPLTLGQKQHEVFLGRDLAANPDYSQEIAFEIDKEIRNHVDAAFEKANTILSENRAKLDAIADALMANETIEKEELQALLDSDTAGSRTAEEASASQSAETGDGTEVADKKQRQRTKPKLGPLRPAEG